MAQRVWMLLWQAAVENMNLELLGKFHRILSVIMFKTLGPSDLPSHAALP